MNHAENDVVELGATRPRTSRSWMVAFGAIVSNLSISTKLFLMIVITSLIVAVASALGSSISYNNGFLGYLNDASHEQMYTVASRLAAGYKEHGNWQFVKDDLHVLFDSVRGSPYVGPVQEHPVRPSVIVLVGLEYRLTLFNEDQQRIAGNPELDKIGFKIPVMVDGKTVGWLGEVPFADISGPAFSEFERNHIRSVWLIALASVLVAALVAFPLSKWLTGPLRRIALATHRLAAGDYAERLQIAPRDEIGLLAKDFDVLAQTLDRNEKMRRSFIADISHELRTPLAILRGELEAIEDGVRSPNRVTMKSLEAEVAIMSKLVRDLYDLALSDVGRLAYRKSAVDAGFTLNLAINSFAERVAEQGLTMSSNIADDGLLIDADEERIHQLFNNLLENSCRYTDSGGQVRVSLRYQHNSTVIDIDDSAPAVPDSQLQNLFQRFYRVEGSRNRATGGAGLGLALCREIVSAHDGTIEARHSLLGGLRVRITLPLRANQES